MQIKEAIKACWAQGDYTKVARGLRQAAGRLIASAEIKPGERVLDVAAGDGNAAILAAAAGAKVTAADLSPKMVALGKARSQAEGLKIKWVQADMEDLPFGDQRFDHVVSSFGVMCATNPRLAAGELFRVTRCGGKVAMVNWAPQGWTRHLQRSIYKYMPPPPGAPDHMDWGRKTYVRRLFNKHACALHMQREVMWTHYRTVSKWWEEFSGNTPALVGAAKTLSPESFKALKAELIGWIASASVTANGGASFPSSYLITVAQKDPRS